MLEGLSNAVTDVVGTDVCSLANDELRQEIIAIARSENQLAAAKAVRIAEWSARGAWADDGSLSLGHRLARETGGSVKTAKACVTRANKSRSMQLCFKALSEGSLSVNKFDLLAAANTPATAKPFARDEAFLLEKVQEFRFGPAQKFIKYWIQQANETDSETDAKKQLEARSCYASRTFQGTVDVKALLDPINGEVFLQELKRLENLLFQEDWAEAKANSCDGKVSVVDLKRTPAQRRADALVLMATRSAQFKSAKGGNSNAPLLSIFVDYPTFQRVCELSNGVVVTPGQVAQILNASQVRRVVYDLKSRVIDISEKRLFKGAARDAVLLSGDRTCGHSYCDEPVDELEADHDLPASKGGRTDPANGQALCARHNRMKGDGDPPAQVA